MPVHPALRPWVQDVIGYDIVCAPDLVHHGLPSTNITVILAFDEPLDCGWAGAEPLRVWTLVGGLHTEPVVIPTHGLQRGLQLSLSPAGVRRLLRVSPAELSGQLVPGDALGRVLPDALQRQLQESSWPERARLLERHLLRLADAAAGATGGPSAPPLPRRGRPSGRAELDHAWERITAEHGNVGIAQLADELGWSRRYFGERFHTEFGVSPKVAARLARFERATGLSRSGVRLADVAARAGYADQAHMTREWRQFAGVTPTETLQELPNVQEPRSP
ncbi:AraC family transcriptional regulator [Nigerium massiliense]|uniref:AraC family transcriptional regulator n=1 Tax=Nigerium massiliense TaxID=1522317 RepID=UPI00058D1E75|nr:helix-turn-helix domain-containing protein [Nigerium massiliense]